MDAEWTDVPCEVGHAIINWIYSNKTPSRLLTKEGTGEISSDENDSFVLTLMRTAKKFNLRELMNRCEDSLVAGVQVRNCFF